MWAALNVKWQASRASPSLQALTACFTSACDTLKIVSADFAKISMLASSLLWCSRHMLMWLHPQRYGQDSITVMSAYAAVFLLKVSEFFCIRLSRLKLCTASQQFEYIVWDSTRGCAWNSCAHSENCGGLFWCLPQFSIYIGCISCALPAQPRGQWRFQSSRKWTGEARAFPSWPKTSRSFVHNINL